MSTNVRVTITLDLDQRYNREILRQLLENWKPAPAASIEVPVTRPPTRGTRPSRFSEEEVRQIREDAKTLSLKRVAKKWNVGQSTISLIKSHRTYAWVKDEIIIEGIV